jgi:hypothetical protein
MHSCLYDLNCILMGTALVLLYSSDGNPFYTAHVYLFISVQHRPSELSHSPLNLEQKEKEGSVGKNVNQNVRNWLKPSWEIICVCEQKKDF